VATDFAAIANISIALSLIVALVFGLLQFRASARDRRERLTMETLRSFGNRDFAEKMAMIQKAGLPQTLAKVMELPHEEHVKIVQFYQEMESLGLMVDEKMLDLDLVEKLLGVFVVDAWKCYEPLIRSSRDADPYLAEYFEAMAVRLEARMRAAPRVPAYKRVTGGTSS
jgi:hypothetical protein